MVNATSGSVLAGLSSLPDPLSVCSSSSCRTDTFSMQ